MKRMQSEDEELTRALAFLKKIQEGVYCKIDVASLNNQKNDISTVVIDEDIYYYSISN